MLGRHWIAETGLKTVEETVQVVDWFQMAFPI